MKFFKSTAAVLLAFSAVFGMTACTANASDEIGPITEETYEDTLFSWENNKMLYVDEGSVYYFLPESRMYVVASGTEKGSYSTYLDENNNAYFTTFDEDFNFYVDFPNDSKGLVMVRKADPDIQKERNVYYVDEEGTEYFTTEDGYQGVRSAIDDDEWEPFDNGDVDIEELSFEQAQKIAALSLIHDSAVKRYEEK